MAQAEAARGLGQGAAARLGELVRVRTRMQMRPRLFAIVERVVERRAAERGLDPDAYVEHVILTQDAVELEHLIAELTVGETHFFRGPPQFEALRRDIVPSLIQKRRSAQALRALSAGCATGEEAYSLAIVLHECVPNAAWQIEIAGVDINTRFLQKAEAARYSPWSLRDVPDAVRRRYFEADGDMLVFRDELRRLVKFQRLGLTERPLVSTFAAGFDLVVCQNVLYYLEPDVRPSVLASLVDVLAPGGTLVLGPVDHTGDVPGCRAVHVGDVVVYERSTDVAHAAPSYARSTEEPTPIGPVVAPVDGNGLARVSATAGPLSSRLPTLEGAFAAADAGDLRGAQHVLGGVLDAEPEEPRAHLLMGLLLIELGRFEEALDAFRRCVYLDSSMMLALAGASVAARRLGRDDLAERYAARVRALGREKNVDAPVEGWDGMTVGSVLRLFRDGNLSVLRTNEGLLR